MTFYPIKKQKKDWAWRAGLALLASIVLFALLVVPGDGVDVLGNEVKGWMSGGLLFGGIALVSGFYLFRQVVTDYRIEMSKGTLTVVSPKHFGRKMEIKDIQTIGGKGPDDELIRLRSKGSYVEIPNFRTTNGKSLYEVLRANHDPRKTYFCTGIKEEPVDVSRVAELISNRRKYDRYIFMGVAAYLAVACLRLPLAEAFGPTLLVLIYFIYREFFQAEVVVEEDALLFVCGRKAMRYEAKDIMHVALVGENKWRTFVYLANGETLKIPGRRADVIRPLLDVSAAAGQSALRSRLTG